MIIDNNEGQVLPPNNDFMYSFSNVGVLLCKFGIQHMNKK